MKVKRMGITEILRRIWLFSANKIKSSESVSKQPTQLIVELIITAHNCHIGQNNFGNKIPYPFIGSSQINTFSNFSIKNYMLANLKKAKKILF